MDKKLRALVLARLEAQIEAEYDAIALEALANVEARRRGETVEERHCQVVEEPKDIHMSYDGQDWQQVEPEPEPVPEPEVIEEQPPEPEPVTEPEDELEDIDDEPEPVSVDTSDDGAIAEVIEAAAADIATAATVLEAVQSDDLVDIFTVTSKSEMKRLITTAYFSNDDWEAIAMHLIRKVGMEPEKAVNLMVAKKDRFPKAESSVDLAAPSFLGIIQEELMELEE